MVCKGLLYSGKHLNLKGMQNQRLLYKDTVVIYKGHVVLLGTKINNEQLG